MPKRPIELADLITKRTRTVVISWGEGEDDTLEVRYSPDKFTIALNNEIQRAAAVAEAGEGDAIGIMSTLLCGLVTDTDITEDGKPYAVTPENLERLGLPLLSLISVAVQNDFTMGKASANGSSEGSDGR